MVQLTAKTGTGSQNCTVPLAPFAAAAAAKGAKGTVQFCEPVPVFAVSCTIARMAVAA